MNDENRNNSNWNRRNFLKTLSVASGLPFFIGSQSASEAISGASRKDPKPITAEELLDSVPQPILPGRADLVEMYNKCWEIGLDKSERGNEQSGFVDWYIDAAFDNRIFQWDTCFSLAWAKYSQGALPNIESLENFYRKQHEDGAISGVIRKKTGEDDQPKDSPWFTRNNLFSWSEWEYYKVTGDASRFERVVPILADYAEWGMENRRHDNGHYYWSGWSSGMDNSPRSRADKFYPPYSWVDYNGNEALAAYYLVKMAEVIDDKETVEKFSELHDEITRLTNRDMWSDEDRIYWDLDKDGSFMKVKTIASFWPMWGRVVDSKHLEGLTWHLNDPASFNRPHRVPTTAADEKGYAPAGRYWRGSVWAPTNHMVVKGLQAQEEYKLARDIVVNHLNNQSSIFSSTETVWENYAPEFVKPGQPAKGDFVGWSADGPIAQLIENYIGINIDVPNNRIRWNLLTTEEVGLKNLKFGDATMKLRAKERNYYTDPIELEIQSDRSFRLDLFDGSKVHSKQIASGTSSITIEVEE